jgi:tetratricopeptide (TPR) repeat protein
LNSVVVVTTLAGLTVVALLGVARPFRRGAVPALEPLADPLEDRRTSLLIALKDLDTARESGALEPADYERLRTDTEGRMVRVLRAIDRRDREPEGAAAGARRSRWNPTRVVVVAVVLVVALGVALVPNLLRSAHDTTAQDDNPATSLQFFEQRVREHPHDVAARLDLADRYLDQLLTQQALDQYRAALILAPRNVEALSHAGICVHLLGQPKYGLAFERKALRIDPQDPETHFFEGVILYKGLGRAKQAIDPLRFYLNASPFGSEAQEAQKLLREARADAARASRG